MLSPTNLPVSLLTLLYNLYMCYDRNFCYSLWVKGWVKGYLVQKPIFKVIIGFMICLEALFGRKTRAHLLFLNLAHSHHQPSIAKKEWGIALFMPCLRTATCCTATGYFVENLNAYFGYTMTWGTQTTRRTVFHPFQVNLVATLRPCKVWRLGWLAWEIRIKILNWTARGAAVSSSWSACVLLEYWNDLRSSSVALPYSNGLSNQEQCDYKASGCPVCAAVVPSSECTFAEVFHTSEHINPFYLAG